MGTLLSCGFNMEVGCVELKYRDSQIISIDCTAVKNEFAQNRYQQSELDYLIYNDPMG